jgi:hypothetical protein
LRFGPVRPRRNAGTARVGFTRYRKFNTRSIPTGNRCWQGLKGRFAGLGGFPIPKETACP